MYQFIYYSIHKFEDLGHLEMHLGKKVKVFILREFKTLQNAFIYAETQYKLLKRLFSLLQICVHISQC